MEKLGSNQLLKQNAIWLVFIIEIIIFAIASHGTFVTGENLINIPDQYRQTGILLRDRFYRNDLRHPDCRN